LTDIIESSQQLQGIGYTAGIHPGVQRFF